MTPKEIASEYASWTHYEQMYFLADIAHQITISMRGCYSSTPQLVVSDLNSAIYVLNECQHRIAGHMMQVLEYAASRVTHD